LPSAARAITQHPARLSPKHPVHRPCDHRAPTASPRTPGAFA